MSQNLPANDDPWLIADSATKEGLGNMETGKFSAAEQCFTTAIASYGQSLYVFVTNRCVLFKQNFKQRLGQSTAYWKDIYICKPINFYSKSFILQLNYF